MTTVINGHKNTISAQPRKWQNPLFLQIWLICLEAHVMHDIKMYNNFPLVWKIMSLTKWCHYSLTETNISFHNQGLRPCITTEQGMEAIIYNYLWQILLCYSYTHITMFHTKQLNKYDK